MSKFFDITSESVLTQHAEKKALTLFHEVARRVPAYKDFLKKAHVDHSRIRTIKDFKVVPITDSKNYIAAYPLAARCWDGKLSSTKLIATSSGTTGEPKFWPRMAEQELEAAEIHEWLYRMYFDIHKHSTLVLIGFPMGVYVSGMATAFPSWLVSREYPNMTIMTVGNNKTEMLRTVRHLSDNYDQTILIGHPFFIKDVIETGIEEGINWRIKNLGIMTCSGGFTETWRNYVSSKAGIKKGSIRIFNTYGSSEMLLMAYETPCTIGVKSAMENDKGFLKDLTQDTIPPQVFQFNPALRYIESINKELIFTVGAATPLIKFNLHDRGDVISLSRVQDMIQEHASSLNIKKMRVALHGNLPLVSLYGRSDDTLKFHAVNIYPEHIKAGLMDRKLLRSLTGKFVMRKLLGKKMDEGLEINVELTPGIRVNKHLELEVKNRVLQKLRAINLEYLDMSAHLGPRVYPHIILRPYQDSHYFKPGLKPKYIDPASK